MEEYKRAGRRSTSEADEVQAIEYEKVLERIGFGKTQWSLLIISGLLTLSSLATQTAVGIIAIASQCEFEMSQSQKGLMMAACTTGVFLSTYVWGFLSDIIGRRGVLLYGSLVACALQFFSFFVTNYWLFNIINLLVGLSLGGLSGAVYPYLGEFNTAKHRVVVINYSTMFVSVAAIYVPATAWLVLSYDWSLDLIFGIIIRPWRLLILLNLLPGLIGALWLIPFPESPKLLLAQNKEEEAIEAIDWVSKYNRGRPLMSVLNQNSLKLRPEIISEDGIVEIGSKGCDFLKFIWRVTIPLFHRPHCRNFLISAAAVFLMFFSSNGMQIWYPEIVNRASEDVSPNATTICEILDASFARQIVNRTEETAMICIDGKISRKTYIDNIILGCAFFIGFNIQGLLLNTLGRKNVLLGALSIAAFSVFLLQFVANSTIVLILFCLYILMPGLSISIMLGAVVDFLPTSMRGKAVSICLSLGFLGMIVAANLIGITLQATCIGTFAIFTISLIVCILLVSFLPI